MKLVVALALAGCSAPSRPPPPANVASAPVAIPATDIAFREVALDVAKRAGLDVVGWGKLDLGHLATLRPRTTQIGAYLLEAHGAYTLVVFDWNAETLAFGISDAQPPLWDARPGSSFSHSQYRGHSFVMIEIGFYQGTIVLRGLNIQNEGSTEYVADLYTCPDCPVLVPRTGSAYFVRAVVGPTSKTDELVLPRGE